MSGNGKSVTDCRTCKHNTYKDIVTDFVDCCHPTTIKKAPNWERGDPAFINWMTADLHVSRINELGDCPAHETIEDSPNDQR